MKQISRFSLIGSLIGLLFVLLLSSCNELTKVQKSTDLYEKYSYAKKFYNTGKYEWAASTLADDRASLHQGVLDSS